MGSISLRHLCTDDDNRQGFPEVASFDEVQVRIFPCPEEFLTLGTASVQTKLPSYTGILILSNLIIKLRHGFSAILV